MGKKVVLKIDDREIRMNEFVQRVLSSVVEGFVKALDGVPEHPTSIAITIAGPKGKV